MKRKILIAAAVAAVLALWAPVFADDIVKNPDDLNSAYADHKAVKVGDIVTIIVVEATQGYNSASLKTMKQQSLNGGVGLSSWGGGATSPFPYSPAWGMGGQEYQDGSGKSVRAGGLTAKISARVEKVLSNGQLSIKGTKIVQVNDEKQNLIITGTIRPEDVAADNTILSTFVADAHIEYEGKGPVGEKTSPGILTRILDWLGIF
jgi:flagellar L-ring protein precursor FlgH